VHRPMRRGIGGNPRDGATSVLLSGVYEDDQDRGDEIIYTGQGARSTATGQQIADQDATPGNLALVRSAQTGSPVRVVRSSGLRSGFGPDEGYRYDGLYRVEDHWKETGRSGYLVWRFRLVKIE
jgi:putative restriction endonuclease